MSATSPVTIYRNHEPRDDGWKPEPEVICLLIGGVLIVTITIVGLCCCYCPRCYFAKLLRSIHAQPQSCFTSSESETVEDRTTYSTPASQQAPSYSVHRNRSISTIVLLYEELNALDGHYWNDPPPPYPASVIDNINSVCGPIDDQPPPPYTSHV